MFFAHLLSVSSRYFTSISPFFTALLTFFLENSCCRTSLSVSAIFSELFSGTGSTGSHIILRDSLWIGPWSPSLHTAANESIVCAQINFTILPLRFFSIPCAIVSNGCTLSLFPESCPPPGWFRNSWMDQRLLGTTHSINTTSVDTTRPGSQRRQAKLPYNSFASCLGRT